MARIRVLSMTALLTVLIWAAADSLVSEVGSAEVLIKPMVPPQQAVAGVFRFTRLKAFRKSDLNCSLNLSLIEKFFCKLRSTSP